LFERFSAAFVEWLQLDGRRARHAPADIKTSGVLVHKLYERVR
jgi:hypothetical protein